MANRMMLKTGPETFEGLRQAMQKHYHSLSPRLQQIAVLLMQDPQSVATESSYDLAQELGVPQSTLTRFAKVMGYKKFKEIQVLCKEQYIQMPRNYLERLKLRQDVNDHQIELTSLHLDFAHAIQQSLQMTALGLSSNQLQRATHLIQNATEVWIHGVRRAYPVAIYLHYLLLKLGIRVSMLDDNGGLLEPSLCRLHSSGILLVVTYSPHANETEKVLEYAHQQSVQTIALSDPIPCKHVKDIEVLFEIREGDVMGFRALSASMYVAQSLAVQVAQNMLNQQHE